MHKIFKRFLASAVVACFPLVFSACGGGGGGSVEMTTISGTAIKGPIKGALVQVFNLRSDGTRGELLGSGASGGDASYAIPIPKAKAASPLLMTVSGQDGATYLSESKGSDVAFTSAESFNAVVDTFNPAKKYTVSPLTDAAYYLLQKTLTDNPTITADTRVISAVNARIASLFNVADILADPASDPDYAVALKLIDQMIVNSGAATTLQTMNLINQALVDVESQAYQGYRTVLTAAAATVAASDPSVTAVVNAIVATAANPPIEAVWTDTTAPQTVTNLKAVPGAETSTTSSVTLTWNASATTGKNPLAGYDVYRDGSKIVTVVSAGYVDKPLIPLTTYSYYVVAFDAAGNRAFPSETVSVTTPVAPNLNINASGQLSTSITGFK